MLGTVDPFHGFHPTGEKTNDAQTAPLSPLLSMIHESRLRGPASSDCAKLLALAINSLAEGSAYSKYKNCSELDPFDFMSGRSYTILPFDFYISNSRETSLY